MPGVQTCALPIFGAAVEVVASSGVAAVPAIVVAGASLAVDGTTTDALVVDGAAVVEGPVVGPTPEVKTATVVVLATSLEEADVVDSSASSATAVLGGIDVDGTNPLESRQTAVPG